MKQDYQQYDVDSLPTTEEGVQRQFEAIMASSQFKPDSPAWNKIVHAFDFAAKAHRGQTRISGEPYIAHPLGVMEILTSLNVDATTLIGALLHDVIEDTGVEVQDVAREFGPVVAVLVEGMTKLSALSYEIHTNEDRQAEYFRKMLLSMAQDMRVILIKFADRLHNMRTIDYLPQKTQQRIARETLEIYAPLAHRFGVGRIKWELEDLSLKVVDPVAYRRIAERVHMKRAEREDSIAKFIEPLQQRLDNDGIAAEVFGRAKHFYSIYNKIKRRGKSFEEILDLLAVRIIVDDVSSCYRVLGVVHSLYTPILERFGDYIATPKANMYQSLHTKVLDKAGHVVEVQIRTHEMDQIAEAGIAAHWQYKEHGSKPAVEDQMLMEYYRWLRQLIEGSKEEDSSEEFMRTLKINLFTDEVFVFTPKGKLIQLPRGSTPVDFAFAVHTDVGLTTLGAKINGRMVPLDTELRNGDSVEILTSNTAKPSVNWLRFVKTHRARSKIKRYYKRAHYEDSVELGEQMLRRELQRYKKKPIQKDLLELAHRLGFNDLQGFWAAIGVGDLTARGVAEKYVSLNGADTAQEPEIKTQGLRVDRPRSESGIKVKGGDNLMSSFGNCCNPLPGDPILGYITKNRGIVVHRTDCPNVGELSKDKDRIVEVEWDAGPRDKFPVRLRIVTEDRPNLLRDIADILSKLNIDAVEVNLRTEGTIGIGTLVILVRNLSHLSKLRSRIGKVKGIVQVERVSVAEVV